jgi:hypothetical protein
VGSELVIRICFWDRSEELRFRSVCRFLPRRTFAAALSVGGRGTTVITTGLGASNPGALNEKVAAPGATAWIEIIRGVLTVVESNEVSEEVTTRPGSKPASNVDPPSRSLALP